MNDIGKDYPQFNEIIEKAPIHYNIILLWGVLLFMILVILLSIFIRIPERVAAEVRVTSAMPPVTLCAQRQGKIKLLINEMPYNCSEDEYIAVLENSANTEHMLLLKQYLSNVDLFNNNEVQTFNFEGDLLHLGDVETAYFNYRQHQQTYMDLVGDNKYLYEIKLCDQKVINDSTHLLHLKNALNNNIMQYKIRKKQYCTDSILLIKKAILESEYNQSYLNYLSIGRQIISSRSDIFSREQSIIDTKLRKASLIHEYTQALNAAKLVLQESYNNVLTRIKDWESSYVFKSSQEGSVDFVNLISDGSFISAGEPVFDVVFDRSRFFGVAILPSQGAGAVKRGQKVNVKLDLYPYQEYGILEGVVSNISLSTVDRSYLIYIDLPNGLMSSLKYEFSFAETMYGQAEIITDSKSLISRVLSHIYKLLNPSKAISTDKNEQKNEQKNERSVQF